MLLYISGFNSTPKAFISNNQSVDVYYVIENDYAKDISQLGEIIRQHPNYIDITGHSTGGFYALTLKTIFPDQIRRLHLINPAMDLVKITLSPRRRNFLKTAGRI
jgi:pimeloyl-ACP methyl ester carboxylesterase